MTGSRAELERELSHRFATLLKDAIGRGPDHTHAVLVDDAIFVMARGVVSEC